MKNFIAIAYLSFCEMIGFTLGFAIVFATTPYVSTESVGAMIVTSTGILMVTFGVSMSYKRRHDRHRLY